MKQKNKSLSTSSSPTVSTMGSPTISLDIHLPHWVGRPFLYFNEIDSTNRQLHQLPKEQFTHGIVACADHQTSGRGQGIKAWHSQTGQNLLFSVGLCPNDSHRLILLTLSIAEKIAEFISTITALPVRIKWPNDILVDGSKLGGILTETLFLGSTLERVIIGIGLNVNQSEFPHFEDSNALQAVSLAQLTGVEWNRSSLLVQLCEHIEKAYVFWDNSAPELCSRIHSRLIGYGQWVHVEINGAPVGLRKCLGLTPQGELLFLDEAYTVHRHNHENIRLILN